MLKKNKKINILLTGAGGAGTIFIIKSLKKKYRIVAIDMNKYAAGLYLADNGYLSPPCKSRAYFKKIDQIVKKEGIDVIIPLIDEELLPIRNYYKNKDWPKILLPQEKFIDLCLNKWNLMNALFKAKIPCPKTYLLSSLAKIPEKILPCIVKPITSRGSRGFQVLKNKNSLNDYLKNNPYKKEDLIVQEYIKGKEFTVSTVVSQKGEIISVVPKEIILKKGITKIAVTRDNPEIFKVCRKIQQNFKANGPFNVQLIIDEKDNLPKIFEINPRFSTTAALTIAAGINEVDLLIEDLFGKKISKPKFKKNLLMIRYEDQICFNEKKILKNEEA